MTTAPPPLDPDDDGDAFALAWQQHAGHVESKLGAMAQAFAGMVEQVTTQGDPSRYPDPFALAALNAAVTAWDGRPLSPGEFLNAADAFEAWLRNPRHTTEAS